MYKVTLIPVALATAYNTARYALAETVAGNDVVIRISSFFNGNFHTFGFPVINNDVIRDYTV